jgi:hypothetical protein
VIICFPTLIVFLNAYIHFTLKTNNMFSKQPVSTIPPQKDVISLEEGQNRTNNWRQAVKKQFGFDPNNVPSGFFIPFKDLEEIVNTYKDYVSEDGKIKGCVGARVYLTLPHAIDMDKPIPPDLINGVLVPVAAVQETPPEPLVTYRDIIIPVPSNEGKANTYSIYDVTQPCPPFCDPESPLR